jgi:hypothetical protein
MDDESAKNQEQMKTPTLTPTSSSKTPSSVTGPASTTSSYYLGCRKDANCHCEMCLASINATRDLISCTRLFSKDKTRQFIPSKPKVASPKIRPTVLMTPPMLRSTAKSRLFDGKIVDKREMSRGALGYRALGFIALSILLWVVDSGLVLKCFEPELERELMGRIGDESQFISGDLNGRVGFVQERLGPLVRDGARIRDCRARKSDWQLNQVPFCLSHLFQIHYLIISEVSICHTY